MNATQDNTTPISSGTNNGLFMTTAQSRQASRGESQTQNNTEKSSTAKKLPAGVRLYNQSKNKPKNKAANKFK